MRDKEQKTMFGVVAFRWESNEHVFPIGIFTTYDKAKEAASDHYVYRGTKYSHRIYEFVVDKWDDDIGHREGNKPCIEHQ